MPVLPSSPGAVQVSVMLLAVGLLVARLLTAAGAVVSDGAHHERQVVDGHVAAAAALVREAWTRVIVLPAGAW